MQICEGEAFSLAFSSFNTDYTHITDAAMRSPGRHVLIALRSHWVTLLLQLFIHSMVLGFEHSYLIATFAISASDGSETW